MSAGTISLESALRTCKVNTDWANRIQGNRYVGPASEKTCPIWTGFDLAGRPVHPDTFTTKTGGCNSASDRLLIENQVFRPQYIPYINLDASALTGDWMYNNKLEDNLQARDTYDYLRSRGGGFNQQLTSMVRPGGKCNYDSYQQGISQMNAQQKECQAQKIYNKSIPYRTMSGYYP